MYKPFLCRCLVDYGYALAVDERVCRECEDHVRHLAKQCFCHLVSHLRCHVGIIIEEIVDERVHEISILARVSGFDSLLKCAEDIVLCSLEFGRREAVAPHSLHFGEERPECRLPIPVLEGDIAHSGLACLAEVAGPKVRSEERSAWLARDGVEALGHNHGNHSLGYRGEESDVSAVVGLVVRLAPP